ncbi:hypothetical protein EHQ12_06920 [Leptospira gomenensis]|uniref:Exo-alpha-sialidase n=1 Tax=Leptospira gomenensis TaxID=2484974 RepID=A0A5F1YG89_9LEPT|nr:hypothetical protein [Leptospira gomenensis]TGK37449.1 hypothetical protein EHQ17_02545 [Leptospira gomenensis]TGK40808.1 hypothetical protein EHQ12_06920 [Leptospira gomenensis]TGK43034.1 hypothetical protein EHQ07_12840 [Leptospira gomenensis]TGK59933.1 hypothetical protein EHQ13_11230 [Leptospira gomenensis]
MKRIIFFFIILLLSGNCYRFQENSLDPTAPFSLLRSLFTDASSLKPGYQFFGSAAQRFREITPGISITYITRYFGAANPGNRIDIIFAYDTSTDVIPTNIPGGDVGAVELIGLGPHSTGFYMLFSVQSGIGTYRYFYWTDVVLPVGGDSLTFTEVFPQGPGNKIHQFYFAGSVPGPSFFWCESTPAFGPAGCFTTSTFPPPATLTPVGTSTTCTQAFLNTIGDLVCYESLVSAPYSVPTAIFDGTALSGTLSFAGTLPIGYAQGPTFVAATNAMFTIPYYFGGLGVFIDTSLLTDSIRINYLTNATAASYAGPIGGFDGNGSIGIPNALTSPVFSDVNYLCSTSGCGFGEFIGFLHMDGLNPVPYVVRTNDGGATYSLVSFATLPFPTSTTLGDWSAQYMQIYETFVAFDAVSDRIHTFLRNDELPTTLSRYVSTDAGATWTLLQDIPLSQ